MKKTTVLTDDMKWYEIKEKLLNGEAIETNNYLYALTIKVNFSNTTGGMNLRDIKTKQGNRRLYFPQT